MNITTLANAHDRIFAMKDNKVIETEITSININVYVTNRELMTTKIIISYMTKCGNFEQSQVFLTKQALLDSL
jgi:hypothetical protein